MQQEPRFRAAFAGFVGVLPDREHGEPGGSLLGHLAELGHELALVGKLTRLQLRVDELAIDPELEATAAGWNERQALHLLLVGCQDSVRQTDGLRLIASHRTIF